MQGHTSAQRVAEQRALPRPPRTARAASPTSAAVAGRSARTGPESPWPGRSTRDQGVRFGQEVSEAAPEAPGLGESVQQDQRRARTAHVDMEWHAG